MKKVRGALHRSETKEAHRYRKVVYMTMQFILLFAFWFVLSGRYQIKYVVMGALLAGLVTFLTSDLLYSNSTRDKEGGTTLRFVLMSGLRLLAYVPWLLLSIIKANIQVASLVLSPRMPVEPALLQFKTQYRREFSLVTLANSITLTPGTITVDLKDNTYLIHALVPESAGDLETGLMQNKVGRVFGEYEEPPPSILWVHSLEELE